jgi:hypothetical protein
VKNNLEQTLKAANVAKFEVPSQHLLGKLRKIAKELSQKQLFSGRSFNPRLTITKQECYPFLF